MNPCPAFNNVGLCWECDLHATDCGHALSVCKQSILLLPSKEVICILVMSPRVSSARLLQIRDSYMVRFRACIACAT